MTDTHTTPRASAVPILVAVLAVGGCVGGLLVGLEPIGGDPDRIFRPIKSELARALVEGRLPFWSERFGLGIPLLAESHAAALYPPNFPLYRFLDLSIAYRLAMWGHYVALAASTFAYARVLGIGSWGAALSAISFALCGFQTIQSTHEWAYHALAYLPLCLLAADRFATTGRAGWLAAMALAWGCQILVGHFQVQMWTGVLVLLTGGWRVIADPSGGWPGWRWAWPGAGRSPRPSSSRPGSWPSSWGRPVGRSPSWRTTPTRRATGPNWPSPASSGGSGAAPTRPTGAPSRRPGTRPACSSGRSR
jgi:hypothetical protein